jgi:hypothetical protein
MACVFSKYTSKLLRSKNTMVMMTAVVSDFYNRGGDIISYIIMLFFYLSIHHVSTSIFQQ